MHSDLNTWTHFLRLFPIQASLIYSRTMEATNLKYPPIEEGLTEGTPERMRRAPYRAMTRREAMLNAKLSGGTKREDGHRIDFRPE